MSFIPRPPNSETPNPGVYIIKSKLEGKNITLKGGGGASLSAWAKSEPAEQQWQISPLDNSGTFYTIIHNATGLSLSAVKGKGREATAQFAPPNNSDIRWTFYWREDGGFNDEDLFIQNKATGAVLDLGQSNPADGAPVFVLDDAYPNFEAQKTQAWHLVPV